MPVVHVNVWGGFGKEKTKIVIKNITKVFVDLDIPSEAVEVIVHEIPKTHWGIGGGTCFRKIQRHPYQINRRELLAGCYCFRRVIGVTPSMVLPNSISSSQFELLRAHPIVISLNHQ